MKEGYIAFASIERSLSLSLSLASSSLSLRSLYGQRFGSSTRYCCRDGLCRDASLHAAGTNKKKNIGLDYYY